MHDPHECDCDRHTGARRCITDSESFIRTAIRDSRVRLTPDQLEELIGEGFAILVALKEAYEPGRGGRDPAESRWAGYAAKYLRIKLGDSYHRLQENHRLVAGEDGRRRWEYAQPAASLDQIVESREGADHVTALRTADEYDTDMAATLRAALDRRWEHDRETTVRFGVLLGMGFAATECARRLRIDQKEATLCFDRIRRVAHDLSE